MGYEWVKEKGTVTEKELPTLLQEKMKDGVYISLYAEKIISGILENSTFTPEVKDLQYLLEIRIFDQDSELKIVRAQVGQDFVWRLAQDSIIDEALKEEILFEEKHYLDIDPKVPIVEDGIFSVFCSTSGGFYSLPVPKNTDRMKIINYINYHEKTGNLQISDFRIAGFLPEKEVN